MKLSGYSCAAIAAIALSIGTASLPMTRALAQDVVSSTISTTVQPSCTATSLDPVLGNQGQYYGSEVTGTASLATVQCGSLPGGTFTV